MRLTKRIYYTTALGTLLQRWEWHREHSARYQIRKIKRGLKSGDQNRGMFFNRDYSAKAWGAPVGYEYHFCYPDRNVEITRYFTRRGYTVEKSKFGKNLFIYKRGNYK